MTARAGDTFTPVPPGEPASTKATLRRVLRARRASLTHAQRSRAARLAASRLLRLRRVRSARRIALYLAVGSELSTGPIVRALRRRGVQLFVPAVDHVRRMHFVRLPARHAVRKDALGLPRPTTPGLRCARRPFDLILMPLLGFDASGARLGMGGGYYDRYLARPRTGRRPWRLGYAFALQELPPLPTEAFDVRLDAVATEQGLRICRPSP